MLSYSAIGLNRFRNSKETKTVPPGMDPVAGAAASILDVFVGPGMCREHIRPCFSQAPWFAIYSVAFACEPYRASIGPFLFRVKLIAAHDHILQRTTWYTQ